MGNKSSKQVTSAFVHPGNRTTANKPYKPPANQFVNGQTTSHFVSYGGGNALVLKEGGGPAKPQIGAYAATGTTKPPEYIQVTLPAGVSGGQKIQVQAPDGRLNEIIIPEGFGPGSTFTVEFADNTTTNKNNLKKISPSNSYAPTAAAAAEAVPVQQPPSRNTNYNDGFPQTNYAQAVPANNYSSYPTATDAQVVVVDDSQSTYSSSYTPNYKPTYAPYVSK